MTGRCLHAALLGVPCGPETPDDALCDPCARRILLGAVRRLEAAQDGTGDVREDAYLAGYAQGWDDGRARVKPFADLDGLAVFLVTR